MDKQKVLLEQLKGIINDMTKEVSLWEERNERAPPFTEDNYNALRLCYVLELILDFGLKDTSLFGKSVYWSYLENVEDRLPGTTALLKTVRTAGNSGQAKGRIFIRCACNEGCLHDYISALVWNTELTTKYYNKASILLSGDDREIFLLLLETTKKFAFQFVVKDKALESSNYWSSLKIDLSVLPRESLETPEKNVAKVARLEAPASARRTTSSKKEQEEVGVITYDGTIGMAAPPDESGEDEEKEAEDNEARENSIDSSNGSESFAPSAYPVASSDYPAAVVPVVVRVKSRRRRKPKPTIQDMEPPSLLAQPPRATPLSPPSHITNAFSNLHIDNALPTTPVHTHVDDAKASSPVSNRSPTSKVEPANTPTNPKGEPTTHQDVGGVFKVVDQSLNRTPEPSPTIPEPTTPGQPPATDNILLEEEQAIEQTIMQWEQAEKNLVLSPDSSPVASPSSPATAIRPQEVIDTPDVTENDPPLKMTREEEEASAVSALTAALGDALSSPSSPTSSGKDEKNKKEEADASLTPLEAEKKRLLDTLISKSKERLKEIERELSRVHSGGSTAKKEFPAATEAPVPAAVSTSTDNVQPALTAVAAADPKPKKNLTRKKNIPPIHGDTPEKGPKPEQPSLEDRQKEEQRMRQWEKELEDRERERKEREAAENEKARQERQRRDLEDKARREKLERETLNFGIDSKTEDKSIGSGNEGYSSNSVERKRTQDGKSSTTPTATPREDKATWQDWAKLTGGETEKEKEQEKPKVFSYASGVGNVIKTTKKAVVTIPEEPPVKEPSATASMPSPYTTTVNSAGMRFSIQVYHKHSSKQNVTCPSCGSPLGAGFFLKGARYCHYTGEYYCNSCHNNEKSIIPANLLMNWDSKQYKVCTKAKNLIDDGYNSPLLNVAVINPHLYDTSDTMQEVRDLRLQLKIIGEFLRTCKDGELQTKLLGSRLHLLDSAHIYSLRDLVDAKGGRLIPFLEKIISDLTGHITSCACCNGKGYFCEICNSDHIIFAFQLKEVSRCKVCKALFHKQCFKRVRGKCPKCLRIASIKGRK